eukprot:12483931-Heterocapsa_arctica.AAC.1
MRLAKRTGEVARVPHCFFTCAEAQQSVQRFSRSGCPRGRVVSLHRPRPSGRRNDELEKATKGN